MTQVSTFGLYGGHERTERLFFGLKPDGLTATRIARLTQAVRQEHGLRGAALQTGRFHITLHHLGDYPWVPKDVVAAAREAAASVRAPAFDIALDRIGTYAPDGRDLPMIALQGGHGVIALIQFQRALGRAMNRAGLAHRVKRRFVPHMTLAYDGRPAPERAIEPIRWTADEFILVHSRLGRTEHIQLGRWPLEIG